MHPPNIPSRDSRQAPNAQLNRNLLVAARAFLAAFSARYGVDGVERVYVDRTHVGCVCDDGSEGGFLRYRGGER
jgi:hypothetical protein